MCNVHDDQERIVVWLLTAFLIFILHSLSFVCLTDASSHGPIKMYWPQKKGLRPILELHNPFQLFFSSHGQTLYCTGDQVVILEELREKYVAETIR